jgi:hypothetical protein
MVLPLIPLALIGAGAVSGMGGAALGLKGGLGIKTARESVRQAIEEYEAERAELEERGAQTNQALVALGEKQHRALLLVVERFADFMRRNHKQVKESEKLLLDGLDVNTGQVSIGSGLDQKSLDWISGLAGSAAVGVAANTGVTSAVTALASASTGTAISSLSGVAATNATMAALGGGSLAAGGGGMAAGALALNFVTIGPALLVSGFVVAGQGEKAKTKARASEAQVAEAIAEMNVVRAEFEAIMLRATELGDVLDALVERAEAALDVLDAEEFDPQRHAAPFQEAMHLTLGVRDVASAVLVKEDGHLDEESAAFVVKYKTWVKEPSA